MRGIRLGSIFGIPIKLDATFLLILPVFAYLIGSDVTTLVEEVFNPTFGAGIETGVLTQGYTPFALGAAAAIGLFTCVLLHELGHSAVAMYYGYEIDSITLWLLGGVAQFAEMPEDWKIEFQVAVAGPIVSVALGALGYAGFSLVAGGGQPIATFLLGYLMVANVTLAVFNMLPGFPMDGGRVLRALLARTRTHARATQIAAEVGKGFALLLGLLGLFSGPNLLLVALAFFIYIGAAGEAQQTVLKAAFQGVTVGDVMTAELHTVSPDDSIADLMGRMFRERHTGYPVVENGELVGMVTLSDAQSVDEVERDAMRVDDVMSTDVYTATPDTEAMAAFQTMQEHGVGRLPVVDADGELCGIISRTDLMTAFDIIQQSGAAPSETMGPNLSPFGR
ncbi:CBS domain-containing protein [Halolamina sp. C58]|uniref:CBS domain-containing protein n=1 Tax=Halolamina sp. C58 TaxID=3421640 RepID=UPI003EC09D3C